MTSRPPLKRALPNRPPVHLPPEGKGGEAIGGGYMEEDEKEEEEWNLSDKDTHVMSLHSSSPTPKVNVCMYRDPVAQW